MRKGRRNTAVFPHTVLMLVALMCAVPFLLLVISSFTDENALIRGGYSFVPEQWSVSAYEYLWNSRSSILRAYAITAFVTAVGTTLSLAVTAALGYAISQDASSMGRVITGLVIFSTLFHAGLVPTYIMYARYMSIRNSIAALIFPRLLLNGMNVLIMRTYYKNSVPRALLESARLDGASELRVFAHMVLPLSKPMLATIGFLNGIAYWNDWFNSFIYISEAGKLSIQGLLNRILMDIQFISTSEFAGDMASVNVPGVSIRMAIAVIAIIPVLIAFPFFQKFLVKGISIGAVKG